MARARFPIQVAAPQDNLFFPGSSENACMQKCALAQTMMAKAAIPVTAISNGASGKIYLEAKPLIRHMLAPTEN